MTQTLSTRVAAVVRAEAARRKVPQAQIADRLSVSQAAVSRRMTGRTPFDLDELAIVAQLLDVPVIDLIREAA